MAWELVGSCSAEEVVAEDVVAEDEGKTEKKPGLKPNTKPKPNNKPKPNGRPSGNNDVSSNFVIEGSNEQPCPPPWVIEDYNEGDMVGVNGRVYMCKGYPYAGT